MIDKIVFDILSKDTTDSDPAAVLADLKLRYPEVASLDGLEYRYKSLKTLLSDESEEWAQSKIKYCNYLRVQQNDIAKQDDLPLIQVGLTKPITQQNTSDGDTFDAEIKIQTLTNAAEFGSSSEARNIGQRIRQILEPVNRLGNRQHYCSHPDDFDCSIFQLHFLRIDSWKANEFSLIYKVTFKIM